MKLRSLSRESGVASRRYQAVSDDAVLAATVLHTGGKIYTLNSKHYPMPEIPVQRAWKI